MLRIILISLLMSSSLIAQIINGRFQVLENSDSSFVGNVQVKLDEGSAAIGNAVIRYKFNPNKLTIPDSPEEETDFQIYNFQNGNYVSSVSHPSDDVVSINIVKLFGDDISISNEYLNVAEIRFKVKNPDESDEFQSDVIQFFQPSSSDLWDIGDWVVSYGDKEFQFVNLLYPLDNEENVQSNVTFNWSNIDGADQYQLQLSTDETFTELIFDDSELTDTVKTLSLDNETTYFWRVRYSNSDGLSPFSGKFSFTTGLEDIPQVVLKSPTNDSTIAGTNVMFAWQSVSERDYYQLQVATDSNFTNISNFIDTLHINEINVSELAAGQDYHWRVRASINNAFGIYSESFKFSTAYGDTAKPTLLAPSNKESNVNTMVTFTWENVDSADSYQIIVSEDVDFDKVFYENEDIISNEQTVYNFNMGMRYFWKVRFSNESGNSMYSNVFTFVTEVGNPTIPNLLAPLNNSVDLDRNLTFTWQNDGIADHYKIEVYTDSGIQNLFFSEDSISNSEIKIDNFAEGKPYYWRVRSTNENGNSGFSDIYKFRTRIGEPSILTLIAPMNNSVGVDNNIKFQWNPIDTAKYYKIDIASDSDFSNIYFSNDSVSSTSITVENIEEGMQYYWRIKSRNNLGSETVSNIFNFSTHVGLPNLPVAISPSNNAKNIDNEVSFDWSPVENAECYHLEIASDVNFKSIIFSEDTLTVNRATIENLNEGSKYYWRVKALNDYGNSDYTDKSKFTIKVNKPSDLDSKVVDNEFIKLSWKDNSKVEKRYIIQRKIKIEHAPQPFVAIDTLSSNEEVYKDYSTKNNQTYIYRVYSENTIASSDFSNTTEKFFSANGGDDPNVPAEFNLSQNYPNPFNPHTKINYSLKEMSNVGITIYNILGEVVTTLVNEVQDVGNYTLEWDASTFSSGVYIYVMRAETKESGENFQAVHKMILLK